MFVTSEVGANENNPLRLAIGKRRQNNAADNGEDGGGGADAERDNANRRNRESAIAAEET